MLNQDYFFLKLTTALQKTLCRPRPDLSFPGNFAQASSVHCLTLFTFFSFSKNSGHLSNSEIPFSFLLARSGRIKNFQGGEKKPKPSY